MPNIFFLSPISLCCFLLSSVVFFIVIFIALVCHHLCLILSWLSLGLFCIFLCNVLDCLLYCFDWSLIVFCFDLDCLVFCLGLSFLLFWIFFWFVLHIFGLSSVFISFLGCLASGCFLSCFKLSLFHMSSQTGHLSFMHIVCCRSSIILVQVCCHVYS